ncbi:MAG: hypothetical protein JW963_12870 [Anaerolineales bacterium]|nr:hypothetical protein [Anaerolineales bacterium]
MNRIRVVSAVIAVLLMQSCLCNGCFGPSGGGGGGGGSGGNGGDNGGGGSGGDSGSTAQAIGQIIKERALVRAGPSSSMEEVSYSRDLNNNDAVNVTEGGKAHLDFDCGIQFTLFNDSSVGGIKAELDPDTPPRLAWKLIRGGGSGQVVEPGTELAISVATGTKITILGTRFFFVYDEETEYLTVGKFEGTLLIEIPGQEQFSLDEALVDIAPDGSTRFYPLPFEQDGFESFAGDYNSPLVGLNALRDEYGLPLPGEPEPPPPGEKPVTIVYRALVRPEYDTYAPDLASSWEVTEDGSTWVFRLNTGIVLENGDPFTSYTVLERFDEWEFVQNGWASVAPIDDFTVKIYLEGGDQFLAERGYDYNGFLWEISNLQFEVRL